MCLVNRSDRHTVYHVHHGWYVKFHCLSYFHRTIYSFSSTLSEKKYEDIADATMDSLAEYFEDLQEMFTDDFDVNLGVSDEK